MKIRIEFKLQDMWVGGFWEKIPYLFRSEGLYTVNIYICLIPCFPIHIWWDKIDYAKQIEDASQKSDDELAS